MFSTLYWSFGVGVVTFWVTVYIRLRNMAEYWRIASPRRSDIRRVRIEPPEPSDGTE